MQPAVVVAIFTVIEGQLSVLLIERAAPPDKGLWALPGGALEADETLDGASSRKLQGETGVRDVFLEQLYTFDRLGSGRADITATYFALVNHNETRLREDLDWQPSWHPARALPALAFENERVVRYAEERLRNKLEYSNVAYSLLPAEFTLRDMQGVYEAIIGRPIDKRNFRRRVVALGLIRETGQYQKQAAYRPARLYSFTSRQPVSF